MAILPIQSPGLYSLQIAGTSVLLAANWPAEESDLRPITVERLREILGTDRVTIEDAAAGESPSTVRSRLTVLADPASWLAVVLLGVLGAEVWLASRRK